MPGDRIALAQDADDRGLVRIDGIDYGPGDDLPADADDDEAADGDALAAIVVRALSDAEVAAGRSRADSGISDLLVDALVEYLRNDLHDSARILADAMNRAVAAAEGR